MERKFLEDLGLEKETIDKILDANSADIGKAKKASETATERVKELENQLTELREKLAAFDGVDVGAMKGELEKLQQEMKNKEAEYAQSLADRDFDDLLTAEISAAKGINPKAVAALLDVATLKTSKNQKEDIASAIKTLRESDPNQFKSDEQKPIITIQSGGGQPPKLSPMEAVRERAAQRYAEAKKE